MSRKAKSLIAHNVQSCERHLNRELTESENIYNVLLLSAV